MAIHYDKSYNAEIARTVKNFNQKRNRAIKRGFKSVPAPIKVSDLKARYTSRQEMNKQLAQLRNFGIRKDTLKYVENQGGARSIEWEFNYLKSNVKAAREFFIKEYELEQTRVNDFPGERMKLDEIAKKISTLDLDLSYMNQSQFNSYRAAIREFISKPKKYAAGYRGFLSEVENVMTMVGIDEKTINKFFKKISVLTPAQFNKLYRTNDLVGRVFELADSPIYEGTIKLNTTEDNARELIDLLLEETDDIILEAQEL